MFNHGNTWTCLAILHFVTIATAGLLAMTPVAEIDYSDGIFVSSEVGILFIRPETDEAISIYHGDGSSIVGLAVSPDATQIVWSSNGDSDRGIYRAQLGQMEPTKIVSDVLEVNGLAVDWASSHVYWADAQKRQIAVVDLDRGHQKVIVHSGLLNPRAVVLDSSEGYLYWNDQGTKKIERSRLDGSARESLAVDNLVWPNQMALHPSTRQLLWVDAWHETLNFADQDGSNVTSVDLSSLTKSDPAFGMVIFQTDVYISVWKSGAILRVTHNATSYQLEEVLTGLSEDVLFSMAAADSLSENQTSPCGEDNGACSHLCLQSSRSTYRCTCPTIGGLTLSADGHNCSAPESVLVYALSESGIIGYMDANNPAKDDLFVVGKSSRPVAVGYDPITQFVYWSDVQDRNIQRSKLDGSGHQVVLNASNGLGYVDGLFVDWLHRRLYFTNMDFVTIDGTVFSWHKIESIGLDDGRGRSVIINDVERPRGLWIDLEEGYLYFTDWGSSPRVTRTTLGGSDPVSLRDSLQNPNGVVFQDGVLYLADSHYKSREAGLETTGALYSTFIYPTNLTKNENISLDTPFGLGKLGPVLYVSDWGTESISSFNLETGQVTELITGVGQPSGLVASPRVMAPPAEDSCDDNNCDDLCFAEPARAPKPYKCVCSTYSGKQLKNSELCAMPQDFMLIADLDTIRLTSIRTESMDLNTVFTGQKHVCTFTGIAHDPKENVMYFSDTSRQTIHKATMIGGSAVILSTWETGQSVDNLLLDTTSNRLYWASHAAGQIGFINLQHNLSETLMTGLDNPRGLALDPEGGKLFWTEVGQNPRVAWRMVSNTSRDNVHVVSSNFVTPNALYYDGNQLYVGDSDTGIIHVCNLSVSYCSPVANLSGIIDGLYAMSVQDSQLYISDWSSGSIHEYDMSTSLVTSSISGLVRPTQFVVFTQDDVTGEPTLPGPEEGITEPTTSARPLQPNVTPSVVTRVNYTETRENESTTAQKEVVTETVASSVENVTSGAVVKTTNIVEVRETTLNAQPTGPPHTEKFITGTLSQTPESETETETSAYVTGDSRPEVDMTSTAIPTKGRTTAQPEIVNVTVAVTESNVSATDSEKSVAPDYSNVTSTASNQVTSSISVSTADSNLETENATLALEEQTIATRPVGPATTANVITESPGHNVTIGAGTEAVRPVTEITDRATTEQPKGLNVTLAVADIETTVYATSAVETTLRREVVVTDGVPEPNVTARDEETRGATQTTSTILRSTKIPVAEITDISPEERFTYAETTMPKDSPKSTTASAATSDRATGEVTLPVIAVTKAPGYTSAQTSSESLPGSIPSSGLVSDASSTAGITGVAEEEVTSNTTNQTNIQRTSPTVGPVNITSEAYVTTQSAGTPATTESSATTKHSTTLNPTTQSPNTASPTTNQPSTTVALVTGRQKLSTVAAKTTQKTTTFAPTTTQKPTTFTQTTESTTLAPTSQPPTTTAETTPRPTTEVPTTTLPPTTAAPTTVQPTTTVATTTQPPTTIAPTTLAPTTVAQTTTQPITTVASTTQPPTTVAPTTTPPPTTTAPTTTPRPTTEAPTTTPPTTAAPTTTQPPTTTVAETTTLETTVHVTTLPPTTEPPRGFPPRFIFCPPDRTVKTDGQPRKVWWREPYAIDYDGGRIVDLLQTRSPGMPGSLFGLGNTTIQYTAKDKWGRKGQCTFVITVHQQVFACSSTPDLWNGRLECQLKNFLYHCRPVCDEGFMVNPDMNIDYVCKLPSWQPRFPDGFETRACLAPSRKFDTVDVKLPLTSGCASSAGFQDKMIRKFVGWMTREDSCDVEGVDVGLCDHSRYSVGCKPEQTRRKKRQTDVATMHVIAGGPDWPKGPNSTNLLRNSVENHLRSVALKMSNGPSGIEMGGTDYRINTVTVSPVGFRCLPGYRDINGTCLQCPVGTRYVDFSQTCSVCGPGTYQGLPAQTTCTSCLPGYTSPAAAITPAQCELIDVEPTVPVTEAAPDDGGTTKLAIIITAVVVALIVLVAIIFGCLGVCRVLKRQGELEFVKKPSPYTSRIYGMKPVGSMNGSVLGSQVDDGSIRSGDRFAGVMPADRHLLSPSGHRAGSDIGGSQVCGAILGNARNDSILKLNKKPGSEIGGSELGGSEVGSRKSGSLLGSSKGISDKEKLHKAGFPVIVPRTGLYKKAGSDYGGSQIGGSHLGLTRKRGHLLSVPRQGSSDLGGTKPRNPRVAHPQQGRIRYGSGGLRGSQQLRPQMRGSREMKPVPQKTGGSFLKLFKKDGSSRAGSEMGSSLLGGKKDKRRGSGSLLGTKKPLVPGDPRKPGLVASFKVVPRHNQPASLGGQPGRVQQAPAQLGVPSFQARPTQVGTIHVQPAQLGKQQWSTTVHQGPAMLGTGAQNGVPGVAHRVPAKPEQQQTGNTPKIKAPYEHAPGIPVAGQVSRDPAGQHNVQMQYLTNPNQRSSAKRGNFTIIQPGQLGQPIPSNPSLETPVPPPQKQGVAHAVPQVEMLSIRSGQPLQAQVGQPMQLHLKSQEGGTSYNVQRTQPQGGVIVFKGPQKRGFRPHRNKGKAQIQTAKASAVPARPTTHGMYKKNLPGYPHGWQSLSMLDKTST